MDERLHDIAARARVSIDEVLVFLDSPAGRSLRRKIAAGLIISVPLVMRMPGLRKTFMGRAIEGVGGAALVIKLAELIRDWESSRTTADPT
jgi:hypothetical protein